MGKFNTYADAPEEARLAKERWERQQKNAPRTGSAVVDAALRLFDDSTRKLEGGQQLQDYAAGKIDSTQINEEQRPIGSKAILNGKEVYWAGQNYGYQSKGSYDKLMEEGQFRMGQIAGQRLGSDIVSAISPEAKQAVQSGIETAVQAGVDLYYDSGLVRDAVNALQPTLQVIGGAIRLADRGLEAVSRITNTSRFITDEAVMALATGGASAAARRAGPVVKKGLQAIDKALPTIDDFTGPGSGMALAGAGPMPSMSFTPERGGIVMKSTTSPEWTSPKAGLGSAADPKYAPAIERFEARESAWQGVINSLKESYDAGNISASNLKKELSEIQSIRKGDLSTFDYDPENLYSFFEGLKESPYYKQTRQRGELKALKEARPQDPYDVLKKAQQHHILAKAETKPFVETLMRLMNEDIANKDDLVNFFVWSEKYDLIPGNVQKNLLHMGEVTHTVAKKDPMALHNLLKEAGLEYGSRTGPEMVKRYGLDKVTSADELMQAYDRYLQEIAIPTRDITYKVHDWWYNKTIKTLKGKELAEFKANFAKLQDPRNTP